VTQWGENVDLETMREVHIGIESGKYLPWDYNYLMYSALKDALGGFTAAGVTFLPVGGIQESEYVRWLDDVDRLRFRVPQLGINRIRDGLENEFLRVGEHFLKLGESNIFELEPQPVLESELVVITSEEEDRGVYPEQFHYHIGKRLGYEFGLGIGCEIGNRKRVHIAGHRHFGHSVRVIGLSNEQSLYLQRHGLGESRAMGLGVFE